MQTKYYENSWLGLRSNLRAYKDVPLDGHLEGEQCNWHRMQSEHSW